MRALVAVLGLLATVAHAQYFGGIRLPVSGQTITRVAKAEAGLIDSTMFVGTTVPAGSMSHEWNLIASLQNYGLGDNVAAYMKADKYSDGPTFGQVVELQDTTGRGAIWGLEVDVMTKPDQGQGNRFGVGLVLGRNGNWGAPGYVDWGFLVVPWHWKTEEASVGYGVAVMTDCRYACFMLRGGQRFGWDGPQGEITQRFDPETGFMEFLFRGQPVWQLQMETGELRIKGKTVKVETQ